MYKNFGFKENIFNTASLNPCHEDLEKFIGRGQDIKSLTVDISSSNKAITVVTGHRGVGKTSFVNVIEYAVGFERDFVRKYIPVDIPQLIPCYHKVQIEPEDNVKSVLSKSLSSLLFSIGRFAEEKNLKIPTKIKELLKWISDISSTAQGGSLSVGGFGASYSHSKQHKNISDIPTTVLEHKIQQAVKLAVKSFKLDGIFLNINNVDILEEKFFCDIFNQLRDYLFNIKGLWSVIIGQPGLYSSLYQQAARVSEIISGQETKLDPLTEEDLISVLKVRRKIYSNRPTNKPPPLPVEEGFVREIYKHSDGEIRPALKVCDDMLRAIFKNNPNIKIVTNPLGKPVLKNILTQQLSLDNLKPKERQILRDTLQQGSFRPKDYEKLKLKSAVDFTNKTRPLVSKGLLKKEVKGNTAKYMVTGSIHLAKYAGINI